MKMVRAKVSGYSEKSLSLFEPDVELLKERGLSMTEATTEPDINNCVTLIIQNESHTLIYLSKDQVLGKVYPASLQVGPHESEGHEQTVPLLNMLQSSSQTSLRESPVISPLEEPAIIRHEHLLNDLNLDQANTTEDQYH